MKHNMTKMFSNINVYRCRNSDGFLTIFTFGTRRNIFSAFVQENPKRLFFLVYSRFRSLQNLTFSKLQTFELYQNRLHKKAFNINVFVFENPEPRVT